MFVHKAKSLGARAEVLMVDLSHSAINVELGKSTIPRRLKLSWRHWMNRSRHCCGGNKQK
ncbi:MULTISPECIES: hypothetical protein [Amphritea]|uniref:hypothetical protein n=1 Tax=Amphritea TaxID=515417 RepID=UPI001C074F76|nr:MULTISPECIES: hypothetical protein [Amphritea]MBU2967269.1 hypothetical protein [Amphritea atlantica]